jgi:hypothetical protein
MLGRFIEETHRGHRIHRGTDTMKKFIEGHRGHRGTDTLKTLLFENLSFYADLFGIRARFRLFLITSEANRPNHRMTVIAAHSHGVDSYLRIING